MKCICCGTELTTGDLGQTCFACKQKNMNNAIGSLTGWICPRCGKVHSPYSIQCDCPPHSVTFTGTSTGECFYRVGNSCTFKGLFCTNELCDTRAKLVGQR